MMKMLGALCAATAALSAGANDILPLDEGLTLAQFGTPDAARTLLVTADDGATLTGHDLSALVGADTADPFELAARFDWKTFTPETAPVLTVPYADLLPAARWSDANVAAGVNYRAHAEESSVEGGMFLFPKLAAATPAQADLPAPPGGMLDYEVELGVVFDRDLKSLDDLDEARAAFFVCNDFTERATLARQADRDDVRSGKGFPDAKGFTGSFQTGPYLVLPHDWKDFTARVTLSLDVNGAQRQNAPATDMEVPIPGLVQAALDHGNTAKWNYHGTPVPMLPSGYFARGTALLTGTPAGVVFAPPGNLFVATSALHGLVTLGFRDGGFEKHVIERFIASEIAAKRFLQPGDTVVARATWLGAATTNITGGE